MRVQRSDGGGGGGGKVVPGSGGGNTDKPSRYPTSSILSKTVKTVRLPPYTF